MVHPVIAKTFGGLSFQYYARHFLFGLAITAFYFFVLSHASQGIPLGIAIFFILNTFLYPYARFVYESIIGFIMGNNVFFVNAIILLVVKIFTMVLCWACAIFIAPVGLAYLYYHHTKAERKGQ